MAEFNQVVKEENSSSITLTQWLSFIFIWFSLALLSFSSNNRKLIKCINALYASKNKI